MTRKDVLGCMTVMVVLAGLLSYRAAFIEPRAWGATCAAVAAPFACLVRTGLLWLQYQGLWGLGALALGLWAFLGGPFAIGVAAVALGAAAVVNYNATYGMLGAALGAWAWLGGAHALRQQPQQRGNGEQHRA
jgi:hypothetical protein